MEKYKVVEQLFSKLLFQFIKSGIICTQLTFTSSKSTMETPEKDLKYVQS